MGRFHRRLNIGMVALLAAATPMATVGPAEAGGRHEPSRHQLTVMTQNLYLGSPLTPALDPSVDTAEEFVTAVAHIYGTALATDFPSRAQVIADTTTGERPDLIGLQEVSDWVATPNHAGPTPISQDFLQILLAELEERGLDYEVAAVVQNADIGPVPLVAPQFGCGITAADCVVSLKDRDVILVNADTPRLRWSRVRTGRYDAQQTFTPPDSQPVSFARGWVKVRVKYRGERFRFLNTHLEVSGFPDVQEAQAREFVAGPASSRRAVIAVGDFNSAADGSTTQSYDLLTDTLTDAWGINTEDPGYTSGQNGSLSNETSQLNRRIDLVLTRSSCRTTVKPLEAHVVGDTAFQDTAPRWPSDHAGVVARLALR